MLTIQLKEERKEIRLLEEENSEVTGACAEWTALAQRLQKALMAINAKAASWKDKPPTRRTLDMGAIRQISAEALAGDGGQDLPPEMQSIGPVGGIGDRPGVGIGVVRKIRVHREGDGGQEKPDA